MFYDPKQNQKQQNVNLTELKQKSYEIINRTPPPQTHSISRRIVLMPTSENSPIGEKDDKHVSSFYVHRCAAPPPPPYLLIQYL
jgi:hypothetical protein